MGINIPEKEELIAHQRSLEEIADYFKADSVQYLSVDGLRSAVGGVIGSHGHCIACLTNQYPVEPENWADW